MFTSPMNQTQLKNIIEAAIMTADTPASMDYLLRLFTEEEQVGREEINEVLTQLEAECESRGIELKQVASGYRYQARQDLSPWLSRLEVERPSRYSRALLETLSLIVYRQPVTRAEIEDVRGVAVSSSIIKTLLEREWVRVVGHRDVPGKPALYGTTRQFLDYFNLKSLSELPPLAEIRSLDSIQNELELKVIIGGEEAANAESIEDEPTVASEGDADEAASAVEEAAAIELVAESNDEADPLSGERETVVSSDGNDHEQLDGAPVAEKAAVEYNATENDAVEFDDAANEEAAGTASMADEPEDSEDPPAARAG